MHTLFGSTLTAPEGDDVQKADLAKLVELHQHRFTSVVHPAGIEVKSIPLAPWHKTAKEITTVIEIELVDRVRGLLNEPTHPDYRPKRLPLHALRSGLAGDIFVRYHYASPWRSLPISSRHFGRTEVEELARSMIEGRDALYEKLDEGNTDLSDIRNVFGYNNIRSLGPYDRATQDVEYTIPPMENEVFEYFLSEGGFSELEDPTFLAFFAGSGLRESSLLRLVDKQRKRPTKKIIMDSSLAAVWEGFALGNHSTVYSTDDVYTLLTRYQLVDEGEFILLKLNGTTTQDPESLNDELAKIRAVGRDVQFFYTVATENCLTDGEVYNSINGEVIENFIEDFFLIPADEQQVTPYARKVQMDGGYYWDIGFRMDTTHHAPDQYGRGYRQIEAGTEFSFFKSFRYSAEAIRTLAQNHNLHVFGSPEGEIVALQNVANIDHPRRFSYGPNLLSSLRREADSKL